MYIKFGNIYQKELRRLPETVNFAPGFWKIGIGPFPGNAPMWKLVQYIIEQIGAFLVNPPRYNQQHQYSCQGQKAKEKYNEQGIVKPERKPGRGQKGKQITSTWNDEHKQEIPSKPPANETGIQHGTQEFFIGQSLWYRDGVLHGIVNCGYKQ